MYTALTVQQLFEPVVCLGGQRMTSFSSYQADRVQFALHIYGAIYGADAAEA